MSTYTLKSPIAYGSETITALTFRAAKGKDMRGLTFGVGGDGSVKMAMGDMLTLAARLASVPPSVIDELSAADAMEVVTIAAGFIGAGPTTG